jgi:putative membrane protein
LAFSRVIAWMLHHYHQLSYGFITGMLLGSLLVLWPWQQAQSFYTNSDGELHALRSANLTPMSYAEVTGHEPLVFISMMTLVIGLLLVLLLHRLSNPKSPNLANQES